LKKEEEERKTGVWCKTLYVFCVYMFIYRLWFRFFYIPFPEKEKEK
jgi:hypothetical protein